MRKLINWLDAHFKSLVLILLVIISLTLGYLNVAQRRRNVKLRDDLSTTKNDLSTTQQEVRRLTEYLGATSRRIIALERELVPCRQQKANLLLTKPVDLAQY
jgi:septal ring factor EnvC (AmiA/AmiB activator)